MNQLSFTRVNDNIDPNEVAWHNMKVADEMYSLQWFVAAATAWLSHNKIKNHQELERELRKRNFNTHLFAHEKRDDPNLILKYPSKSFDNEDTSELKYECFYSCRPKEYALKEVIETNGSYEANFEKLKYAGVICVNDIEKTKDISNLEPVSIDENNPIQLVSKNKGKIEIKKVTEEEAINGELEKIKIIYGKEPELSIIGMGQNGEAIMGMTIGGKLVSNIGVAMSRDKDGNLIKKIIPLHLQQQQ